MIKIFTPYGSMGLKIENDKVIEFLPWKQTYQENQIRLNNNEKKIVDEINNYFLFKIKTLKSPIEFRANLTNFQLAVFKCVQTIPYGQTKSYQEIAQLIGHSQAQRAVGSVLANNNIMFYVPCHRIIKNNGKIGNFSGFSPWIKRQILTDEKKRI